MWLAVVDAVEDQCVEATYLQPKKGSIYTGPWVRSVFAGTEQLWTCKLDYAKILAVVQFEGGSDWVQSPDSHLGAQAWRSLRNLMQYAE